MSAPPFPANDSQLSVVYAQLNSTGPAVTTSNDDSLSIAVNGTGDFTLTFGHAFLAAPIATVSALNTTAGYIASVHSTTTTTVRVLIDTDASTAVDTPFMVIVAGRRDR